jgi:hypothetical protein
MPEVYFDYTLRGRLVAPAGSKLNDTGSGIILPDGREIKIWEQLEISTPNEDDHRNLAYDELEGMGLFYDGDCTELDGPFELPDDQLWPPK